MERQRHRVGINHTFLRVDSGNWLSVDGLSSFDAILLQGGHHNVTLVTFDMAGNEARDIVEFSVQIVPGAPESVNATAGASGIGISWAVPFDGGSPILSFKVFRSGVSGTYNSTPLAIAATGMYFDSGVVAGTKYFYAVRASNSQGDGPASVEVNATLADGPRPPDAPTGLNATPGTGFVSLSWSPPSDRGASAVISFRVYRTSVHGANPSTPIATLSSGQLHYIDSSLISGTFYYKVSAIGFAEGPRSNESEAVVDGIQPGSPGTIVSMSLIEEQSSIRLSWSAPPEGASSIFRYLIYRSLAPFDPVLLDSTSSMSYEDENATVGQTYHYWIVAENAQGQGPLSAVMTGSLLSPEPGIGFEALALILIMLAIASFGLILYRRRRK